MKRWLFLFTQTQRNKKSAAIKAGGMLILQPHLIFK